MQASLVIVPPPYHSDGDPRRHPQHVRRGRASYPLQPQKNQQQPPFDPAKNEMVPMDNASPLQRHWLQILGGALAEARRAAAGVQGEPDQKLIRMSDFPANYKLYEHVHVPKTRSGKTPSKMTRKDGYRRDPYVFGHPSGRRFRSPAEMIPHVLWLDHEPSTRSKYVCSCNVCNPRSKTSGSTTLPKKPTALPNPPGQPNSIQLRPLLPAWPPAQILGMYPALSIAQSPNLPPVKAPTRFLANIPLPPRTPSPTPDQIVAPATPIAIKPEPTWCAQNDTPAVQTEFEFVNVGLEEMRRERKRKRNWKTPIWAPVETKEWEWVVFDMAYFARRRGMNTYPIPNLSPPFRTTPFPYTSYMAPVLSTTYTTPVLSTPYTTPVLSTTYTSPVLSTSYTTPVLSTSYTTPVLPPDSNISPPLTPTPNPVIPVLSSAFHPTSPPTIFFAGDSPTPFDPTLPRRLRENGAQGCLARLLAGGNELDWGREQCDCDTCVWWRLEQLVGCEGGGRLVQRRVGG